jgi:transglutaminase-like putative cysteine protease
VVLMGLTALGAVVAATGDTTLPALYAAALSATRLTPHRLPEIRILRWLLRLFLLGWPAMAALGTGGAPGRPGEDLMLYVRIAGRMAAAEMVLQVWRAAPAGGRGCPAAIPLSGFVFLSAVIGTNLPSARWVVPVYMILLVAVMRGVRSRAAAATGHGPRAWSASAWAGALLAATLLVGSAGIHQLWLHRNTIRRAILSLDFDRNRATTESVGFSIAPRLGPSSGLRTAPTRVMRVEGTQSPMHLRGLSFDTYAAGAWEPALPLRRTVLRDPAALAPVVPGRGVRVTRLRDELADVLFLPIHAAGVDRPGPGELRGDLLDPGLLRCTGRAPHTYGFTLAEDRFHQGPLCRPPTDEQRARCLAVVEDDPEVADLAARIAEGIPDPSLRVAAVADHLRTRHAYSLSNDCDPARPIADFLLNGKSGHCEYFASAAVALLRLQGVPARYVVGYYAHEPLGDGLVVRQRDAHAWAEAWIDGVGWVTVDATPADGLPQATGDDTPFWDRVREGVLDAAAALRERLAQADLASLGPAVAMAAALTAALRWAWLRRRAPAATGPAVFRYSPPAPDLAALAKRFERLLAARGPVCPPHRTWSEHLSAPAFDEPPGKDLRAWAADYQSLRFGRPDDPSACAELESRLVRLEAGPR